MIERPRGAREFQRLLQGHAADIGQLPQRVMHLVRVGAICALLDDARDDGGHLFIVKGGTAMQIRFGIDARATADLDVVFRGRAEAWLTRFDATIADRDWNGFSITRKQAPTQIDVPGVGNQPWRLSLQIRYEGRDFGSTTFEVAIDETTANHYDLIEPDDIALATFAIDPPRLIPCLDVHYQIAQKLHACTEPVPDGNDRVRDIIDIWLLEALTDHNDVAELRDAAKETFARRAKHQWPPAVQSSPSWERDYPQLAADHPEAPQTINAAIEYLTDLIRSIDTGN